MTGRFSRFQGCMELAGSMASSIKYALGGEPEAGGQIEPEWQRANVKYTDRYQSRLDPSEKDT